MAATAAAPERQHAAVERRRITVTGAVQGVGFRPFVYREAVKRGLSGRVANGPAGVIIEIEGDGSAIADLLHAIRQTSPPAARIDSIGEQALARRGEDGFEIDASRSGAPGGARVLADLATCETCLNELSDPADRRYRYPFITCADCGPRYSIAEALPFDRERTSMRRFPLCPACRAEYGNPANRRFHAETIACPDCGPQLALLDAAGGTIARADAAVDAAAAAVRDGRIVAVKSIGGFQLWTDARNEDAVRRLRRRKNRPDKPFAVMFPDPEMIAAACMTDRQTENLLTGPERPIALLPRRANGDPAAALAPSVAPDSNPRLGAMLPSAPLHHLLLQDLGFPVVATSGNLSGEPIVTDETEAVERLGGVADFLLVHDRPILRPLDDSVVQIVAGTPQFLRRGRGHAPTTLTAPGVRAGIQAFGGHLKATVALSDHSGVTLGPHVGDLETPAARSVHRRSLDDIAGFGGVRPRTAVCDMHPDYASTRAAESAGLPLTAVQHHIAHAAACLAGSGIEPPALGVVWDGTGYGPDGTIWGGEFLLLERSGWRRVARLRPFRLPGGDAASREPRRAALGLLHAAFGERALEMTGLAPVAAFPASERGILGTALARGANAPQTSSAGRLFDAAAALCGLRQHASYEGQAAAMLEWAAMEASSARAYDFPVHDGGDGPMAVDWQPALEALLADLRDGADVPGIARAFHSGLARAIADVARRVGQPRVALSGGCFQNVLLTEAAAGELRRAGFEPVLHGDVPPNDGGLAFGQAAWAGWMERAGETPCA